MKKWSVRGISVLCICLLPAWATAQGVAGEIRSLQDVLDTLYADLLPLCGKLIGVGRGLAGFGATWYIASRVWGHIARAESIDFYPLFRPFALGLAVLLFPYCISILNSVLQPTVDGTGELVANSKKAIAVLLEKKDKEVKESDTYKMMVGEDGEGDRDLWMKYYHKDEVGKEGVFGKVSNSVSFSLAKMSYNFRNAIKRVIATILEILYEAAALCINTLRTFKLLILAIIGPLVFGLAVFDGFQHILQVYLARYINIFLWLPIANILGALLGKIQENMIKLDLDQIIQNGDTSFSSYDLGYIIFMIIGIICYTTVPSIADEIVFVGGGGAMQQKITMSFNSAQNAVTSGTGSVATGMAKGVYGDAQYLMGGGMSGSTSGDYASHKNPMHDKLSG